MVLCVSWIYQTLEDQILHQQFHPSSQDNNLLILDVSQKDTNLIMDPYATFSLTGQNIISKSIKDDKEHVYLKAVTELFLDMNQWDPSIIITGDSEPVLKRWEPIPNRQ